KIVWGKNLAATQNAVPGIAEIDTDHARGRSTLDNRRAVSIPGVAAIDRRQNSRFRGATCSNPSPFLSLRGNTRSAGRESCFPGKSRRQFVANILPGVTVGRANHRKTPVHRVGHGQPAHGIPKRKAVIKRVRVLVLELKLPGLSAVFGLVNTRIRPGPGGQKISDRGAHSLNITKLKGFRSGDHVSFPMLATVRSQNIGTADPTRPHDALINRANGLEPVFCTTLLLDQSWFRCSIRNSRRLGQQLEGKESTHHKSEDG